MFIKVTFHLIQSCCWPWLTSMGLNWTSKKILERFHLPSSTSKLLVGSNRRSKRWSQISYCRWWMHKSLGNISLSYFLTNSILRTWIISIFSRMVNPIKLDSVLLHSILLVIQMGHQCTLIVKFKSVIRQRQHANQIANQEKDEVNHVTMMKVITWT